MKKILVVCSILVVLASVFAISCNKENQPKVMEPKDVVSAAMDAFIAQDYKTFWSYFDLPDARKNELQEAYQTKADNGDITPMKSYTILSTSMDEINQTATVNVKYNYANGKTSDPAEWQLVKKDGKWKIVTDK